MTMVKQRSGMAAFKFTSIIVCIVLLGHGTRESTASTKEDHRDDLLKGIISKWKKEAGVPPQPETNKDQSLPTWVRGIVGGLKTLFPTKNLPSLNKPIDRHRLSGFLYNISLYLQEMGAELEDVPPEQEEEQLWEKVLHFFLQSEGNAALNQWNGRVPPRPSIKMQDWFLSLRGSPHWDWLLGLLQSLITLSERQPHRPILTFLSQNWRTLSAVLEAAFQALISGTYGQASAGLQGFICALKGRSDCTFSVSWLQQLLQFLETRNWKPVVSLHPAGEPAGHGNRPSAFGRFKPFSVPPEAIRQGGFSANTSEESTMAIEDESDSMQSFLLQVLSRSGAGNRSGQQAQKNLALVQSLDGLRRGLLHRVGSSVYGNLRKKVSRVTMALLDDVSSLVEVPQPNFQGRCTVGLLSSCVSNRLYFDWNESSSGQHTMEEHIMRLCEELEREREERNYFQLERDMVQSSLDVTNKKLEKVKAELKIMDKAIEDDEASHQVEIKVFKQKMKHLLCEHQNTISELGAERIALAEVLQNEQDQLEEERYKEMRNILVDMRTSKNEEVVKELQLKHEKELAAVKEKWERLLADTARKSNADIKQLQQELDIKRKSGIFARKLQLERSINELKEDQKRALNDARDFFLKRDNSSKITDLEEQHFKMTCQLKQMKEELPTLLKENEELTGLVAEAKGELNLLERRAKFLPMTKGPISIPQKKEVKELRKYRDELQEKFNQLYMEVDEMRSSFPQKILIAEEKADRSLRPLEDELQAAKERLEKIQVQLNLVPSAPNLDQIAVAEITDKVKKESLEATNSSTKNLKYKRSLIDQVGSGMWQRPGANKGGFCN